MFCISVSSSGVFALHRASMGLCCSCAKQLTTCQRIPVYSSKMAFWPVGSETFQDRSRVVDLKLSLLLSNWRSWPLSKVVCKSFISVYNESAFLVLIMNRFKLPLEHISITKKKKRGNKYRQKFTEMKAVFQEYDPVIIDEDNE